jgi:Large ribosomal RNA subunit accumulation protein YceD
MTEPLEFSRIVKVDTLPGNGLRQKIAADETERAKLARRYKLPSVESLEAEFHVTRSGRGARVRGQARARVTQTCIVSLEPFPAEVDEEIDVRFAPPSPEKRAPKTEEEIRFEAEDEPDPLIDGCVDIGELAAEFIALGLDPYPRKPGVDFEPPAEETEEPSPFVALESLRNRRERE